MPAPVPQQFPEIISQIADIGGFLGVLMLVGRGAQLVLSSVGFKKERLATALRQSRMVT